MSSEQEKPYQSTKLDMMIFSLKGKHRRHLESCIVAKQNVLSVVPENQQQSSPCCVESATAPHYEYNATPLNYCTYWPLNSVRFTNIGFNTSNKKSEFMHIYWIPTIKALYKDLSFDESLIFSNKSHTFVFVSSFIPSPVAWPFIHPLPHSARCLFYELLLLNCFWFVGFYSSML